MMTLRTTVWVALFALLFGLVAAAPSPWHTQAYAQAATAPTGTPTTADVKTVDANGNPISCDGIPEVQGGKLLGKIVPCMVYTINQSTVKFTEEMVKTLEPLLLVFLTLVVVLFGVRMQVQEPEIAKQGFLLLVKIAIVGIILSDFGNYQAYDGSGSQGKLIPAVYAIMNESQAIVAGAIDTTNLHCDVANFKGPQTPQVWAMMDCVLGKLYGFTTGTAPGGGSSTNMLLVASFFGLMSGFFFGGAWGVVIFMGMLGTLFTIFMMVVRTAIGFVTSYLTICLLFILSPLFFPLVFLKVTSQYFENSWRIILAAFLTPVLITAYSMFALILYDKVLFDPAAPIQTLFDYSKIKDALQPARAPCNHPITNNPTDVRFSETEPTATALAKKFTSPFLQNNVVPTLSGANDPCATLQIHPIDETKIQGLIGGANAKDRKEAFQKMFEQLLSLFIIAYLIHKGLGLLSGLITQIVGKRSAVVASDGLLANMDMKQRTEYAFQNAISRFRASGDDKTGATYKSGSDFIRDVPRDSAAATRDTINILTTGKTGREQ